MLRRRLFILFVLTAALTASVATAAAAAQPGPSSLPPTCDASRVGDGWCDDARNNNAACHWDGGDCCSETCETCKATFACRDPSIAASSRHRLDASSHRRLDDGATTAHVAEDPHVHLPQSAVTVAAWSSQDESAAGESAAATNLVAGDDAAVGSDAGWISAHGETRNAFVVFEVGHSREVLAVELDLFGASDGSNPKAYVLETGLTKAGPWKAVAESELSSSTSKSATLVVRGRAHFWRLKLVSNWGGDNVALRRVRFQLIEVAAWSSQQSDAAHAATNLIAASSASASVGWTSAATAQTPTRNQWIIFKLSPEWSVVSLKLHLWGAEHPTQAQAQAAGAAAPATSGNPKNCRLQTSATGTAAGPWSDVAVLSVPSAAARAHTARIDGGVALFWRLYLLDNWGADWGIAIERVEFDLVRVAGWSSQSRLATSHAPNLVLPDHDWATAHGHRDQEWVAFDVGTSRAVSSIVLQLWGNDGNPKDVSLQVSSSLRQPVPTDASMWKAIGSFTIEAGAREAHIPVHLSRIEQDDANYIRVVVWTNQGASWGVCIRSIQFHTINVVSWSSEANSWDKSATNLISPLYAWHSDATNGGSSIEPFGEWVVFDVGHSVAVHTVRCDLLGTEANPRSVQLQIAPASTGPWTSVALGVVADVVSTSLAISIDVRLHKGTLKSEFWRLVVEESFSPVVETAIARVHFIGSKHEWAIADEAEEWLHVAYSALSSAVDAKRSRDKLAEERPQPVESMAVAMAQMKSEMLTAAEAQGHLMRLVRKAKWSGQIGDTEDALQQLNKRLHAAFDNVQFDATIDSIDKIDVENLIVAIESGGRNAVDVDVDASAMAGALVSPVDTINPFVSAVSWSSERNPYEHAATNLLLSTDDWVTEKRKTQGWVTFRIGSQWEVSSITLELWGSDGNPKRGNIQTSSTGHGPWLDKTLFTVPSAKTIKHVIHVTDRSEFWRLRIYENWGATWGVGLSRVSFSFVSVKAWSSQENVFDKAAHNLVRYDRDEVWTSEPGGITNQWITFDIGPSQYVASVQLSLFGTTGNPQDCVLELGPSVNGPWGDPTPFVIPSMVTTHVEVSVQKTSRFWKLSMANNFGATWGIGLYGVLFSANDAIHAVLNATTAFDIRSCHPADASFIRIEAEHPLPTEETTALAVALGPSTVKKIILPVVGHSFSVPDFASGKLRFHVPTEIPVGDIEVVFHGLRHSWSSDLVVTLYSPAGVAATLVDRSCACTHWGAAAHEFNARLQGRDVSHLLLRDAQYGGDFTFTSRQTEGVYLAGTFETPSVFKANECNCCFKCLTQHVVPFAKIKSLGLEELAKHLAHARTSSSAVRGTKGTWVIELEDKHKLDRGYFESIELRIHEPRSSTSANAVEGGATHTFHPRLGSVIARVPKQGNLYVDPALLHEVEAGRYYPTRTYYYRAPSIEEIAPSAKVELTMNAVLQSSQADAHDRGALNLGRNDTSKNTDLAKGWVAMRFATKRQWIVFDAREAVDLTRFELDLWGIPHASNPIPINPRHCTLQASSGDRNGPWFDVKQFTIPSPNAGWFKLDVPSTPQKTHARFWRLYIHNGWGSEWLGINAVHFWSSEPQLPGSAAQLPPKATFETEFTLAAGCIPWWRSNVHFDVYSDASALAAAIAEEVARDALAAGALESGSDSSSSGGGDSVAASASRTTTAAAAPATVGASSSDAMSGGVVDSVDATGEWVRLEKSDCAWDDIGITCASDDAEVCKATCAENDDCGGFTLPGGALKSRSCLFHSSPTELTLYMLREVSPPAPPVQPQLVGVTSSSSSSVGASSSPMSSKSTTPLPLPTSSSSVTAESEHQQPPAPVLHWWKYEDEDCGFNDVAGTCSGKSVEACKAQCSATSGCGGFSYPQGSLKSEGCSSHQSESTIADLWMLQHGGPQPTSGVRRLDDERENMNEEGAFGIGYRSEATGVGALLSAVEVDDGAHTFRISIVAAVVGVAALLAFTSRRRRRAERRRDVAPVDSTRTTRRR